MAMKKYHRVGVPEWVVEAELDGDCYEGFYLEGEDHVRGSSLCLSTEFFDEVYVAFPGQDAESPATLPVSLDDYAMIARGYLCLSEANFKQAVKVLRPLILAGYQG